MTDIRKLAAEMLGSYVLVLIGCSAILAAGASGATTAIVPIALGFGLALLVGLYAFGEVSGGPLQPSGFARDVHRQAHRRHDDARLLGRPGRRRRARRGDHAGRGDAGSGCEHGYHPRRRRRGVGRIPPRGRVHGHLLVGHPQGDIERGFGSDRFPGHRLHAHGDPPRPRPIHRHVGQPHSIVGSGTSWAACGQTNGSTGSHPSSAAPWGGPSTDSWPVDITRKQLHPRRDPCSGPGACASEGPPPVAPHSRASRRISRILSRTIIYLGPPLPTASCDLPGTYRTGRPVPARSCS